MLFRSVALAVLLSFALAGCYNTYYLKQDTFGSLQQSDQPTKSVTSVENESLTVTEDTKLFVHSVGGRRYQVTPFNFKMTKSQIVASDRDYILMTDEVKSYEVDKLSTFKTVGLITIGVAAVGGFIAAMAIMYGGKSIGSEN
jgi:outer membrane lipoprotein SlyB